MKSGNYIFPIVFIILLFSCDDDSPLQLDCPSDSAILSEFVNEDQKLIRIYSDGKAYSITNVGCEMLAEYFDPDFYKNTFNETDSGIYFIVDETTYFKPIRNATLDFEGISDALDLFIRDISQTDRFLSNFTLQSPSTPTVAEYVYLQNCILDGACDFIDNRFELVADPSDPDNTVMKFTSIPPASGMVTSKTSVSSNLTYFEKGDDFWFEAKYYISGDLPTTLADFESSYFLESPGPRIIFRGDQLAIENKFNEKITFNQSTSVSFPTEQWVKVKVHLRYDESDGIIQLWQDDILIIDQRGPNMPFDIWIQNSIEMGITATQNHSSMLIDDIRFSDQPL